MAGILPRRDTEAVNDTATSDAILRAAEELIARDGYHNVTVDDIRRAAGVSRATFYFYFRNKLHLFNAVVQGVVDKLYELAGGHYPDRTEYERIVLANVAYLSVWSKERHILGELFALSLVEPEVAEVYRRHRRRFEERIEGRLERLAASGRIPATNIHLTTTLLSGMIESLAVRYCMWDDDVAEYPFHELVASVSEAWYRTVYGAVPPPYPYEQHRIDAPELVAVG
ncbi:MAG TPA: TetR/AcrR family transcriptional regulator [Tepidiformaceae bacterium]|nr:TetR/AcrR family transcriptional regulator [Tepidiformaceae bacterium]